MKKKITVLLIPPAVLIAALVVSKIFIVFMNITHYICPIYLFTGFLCPGCGGTRSLKYLLKFDFWSSLRCNPSVIIIIISAVVYYVQILINTFGYKKKIIPGNKIFYILITGIIMSFYIIRNFIPVLQPV